MVTVIVTLLIIAAIIYMFNAVGDWFVHNWYYVLGAVILVMVVYGQIINDWPIFDAISDLLYSIREKVQRLPSMSGFIKRVRRIKLFQD